MNALNLTARIITTIALAVNSFVHFQLAPTFDAVAGELMSLGDLFRIQAVAGLVVGVLLLVLLRHRWIAIVAGALAGAGIIMLMISIYSPLDLTGIGLPLISEAAWYPDKLVTLAAQCIAMLTAFFAVLSTTPRRAPIAQN